MKLGKLDTSKFNWKSFNPAPAIANTIKKIGLSNGINLSNLLIGILILFLTALTVFFAYQSYTVQIQAWQHPVQPTKILEENPKIILGNGMLIPYYKILFLENVNACTLPDDINLNSSKNKDEIYLQFTPTADPSRYLIVLLSDPNNIVRLGNIPLDDNNENFSQIFQSLNPLLIDRIVIIKKPLINDCAVYGEWHLNIFIYNKNKQLTNKICVPVYNYEP
jgi:hypothetical protein